MHLIKVPHGTYAPTDVYENGEKIIILYETDTVDYCVDVPFLESCKNWDREAFKSLCAIAEFKTTYTSIMNSNRRLTAVWLYAITSKKIEAVNIPNIEYCLDQLVTDDMTHSFTSGIQHTEDAVVEIVPLPNTDIFATPVETTSPIMSTLEEVPPVVDDSLYGDLVEVEEKVSPNIHPAVEELSSSNELFSADMELEDIPEFEDDGYSSTMECEDIETIVPTQEFEELQPIEVPSVPEMATLEIPTEETQCPTSNVILEYSNEIPEHLRQVVASLVLADTAFCVELVGTEYVIKVKEATDGQ